MRVTVVGAGVAGLATALTLAERGAAVSLVERSRELGGNASWLAGGMLAPFCEGESAPPSVVELGLRAIDWWDARVPGVVRAGTLVVAPPRDVGEIERFAARTSGHERVEEARIAALEPDLAGRFRKGLFFAGEGHLDPRVAMRALLARSAAVGSTCASARTASPLSRSRGRVGVRAFPHPAPIARPEGRASFPTPYGATFSRKREKGSSSIAGASPRGPTCRTSRRARRDDPRAHARDRLHADGEAPPSAHAPLCRAEGGRRIHDRRDDDRERGKGPGQRALGDRAAQRRLRASSGVRRSGDSRDERRREAGLSRQRAAHYREGRTDFVNGFYRHGFLLAPAFAARAADLAFARAAGEPHLGRSLVQNLSGLGEIELPSRQDDRPDPFAGLFENEADA